MSRSNARFKFELCLLTEDEGSGQPRSMTVTNGFVGKWHRFLVVQRACMHPFAPCFSDIRVSSKLLRAEQHTLNLTLSCIPCESDSWPALAKARFIEVSISRTGLACEFPKSGSSHFQRTAGARLREAADIACSSASSLLSLVALSLSPVPLRIRPCVRQHQSDLLIISHKHCRCSQHIAGVGVRPQVVALGSDFQQKNDCTAAPSEAI